MASRKRRGNIKNITSADLQNSFRLRFSNNGSSNLGTDDAMTLLQYSSDQFNSLIDSFFIFGIFPFESENEKPRTLFAYPNQDPKKNEVFCRFCFPNSQRVNKKEKRKSLSLAYNSTKTIDFIPLYFPESSDSPYLFVSKFFANSITMPIICHQMNLCDVISRFDGQYSEFCIAIQSKLPFYSLFQDYVKWYLNCERILRLSISDDIENYYTGTMKTITSSRDFLEENRVKLLSHLTSFLSIPAPRVNESIEIDDPPFTYFKWDRKYSFHNYYPLACEVLYDLFQCLSLNNLIILFSGVLLEKSIVFYHPNQKISPSSVMAMHFLLKPLKWIGSSISILPTDLEDLLSAPNPFIIGLSDNIVFKSHSDIKANKRNSTNNIYFRTISIESNMLCDFISKNIDQDNIVFVDLKNDKLFLNDNYENIPIKNILLNEFSKRYSEIVANDSPVIFEILEKFNIFITNILDKLRISLISDLSTPQVSNIKK
ncbi:hypothetical protein TRFO_34292 [Tritrichomonas foetus]|uniref:UDENN domain-containing protein n=1 Tax=Tritrichomonas foetus TaxID=1144522 RepID=A0A1J4JP53_9EUKA|nr:hypothetical protein TRFO_34292 [Tritrichomonas foetus]|eukprot:OHS99291.1 hypothetical protein TRFO_34292 [Tritrichomonas foetus]